MQKHSFYVELPKKRYVLWDTPEEDQILHEVINTSLKRIGQKQKVHPNSRRNLTPGRSGKRSQGYNDRVRSTLRELLEESRPFLKTMVTLNLPPETYQNATKVKRVWTNLKAKLRAIGIPYFMVMEFKTNGDPHFHIAFRISSTAGIYDLKYYWRGQTDGDLWWNPHHEAPQETIARYLSKSHSKLNPPWFNKAPFQPYSRSNNLPRVKRCEVLLSQRQAAEINPGGYRLIYGAVSKLTLLPNASTEAVKPWHCDMKAFS